MKFLVTTFSAIGHVNSLGPIVAELRCRGHDVVWLTGDGARQAVEDIGAQFALSEHALDWHNDPPGPDPGTEGFDAAVSMIRTMFVKNLGPLTQDLKGVLAWFAADVIITDLAGHGAATLSDMGGPVYCNICHVPAYHLDHNPDAVINATVDDDVTPISYWFGTPQLWKPIKVMLDRERHKLGLDHTPPDYQMKDMLISPFLMLLVNTASLEYPEQLIQPQCWKIGPTFTTQRDYDSSGWLGLVSAANYVVHVSQGTFDLFTTNTKNLIEPTFKALKERKDFLVIGTGVGLRRRYEASEFPSNVYCEDFIPHMHLMPHVDIFISNAGFGGVLTALNYGVPIICTGRTQDKADVSDLVQWRKVGINLNTNIPSPEQILQAVNDIQNNSAFSVRAVEIKKDFARHDAPRTAVNLLEKLALTKKPVPKPKSDWGMFWLNREEIKSVERCLTALFQDQVRCGPNSTAVEAHDGVLTYLALDKAASILADILISRGVRKGDLVPIYFSKSKFAIVAILGILKARAAFVPLDPSSPLSRLRDILDEMRPKAVLTSVNHLEKMSQITGQSLAVQESTLSPVTGQDEGADANDVPAHSERGQNGAEATRVANSVSPPSKKTLVPSLQHPTEDQDFRAIAYVIFTSGSSGTPKGVVMEHRAVCTSLTTQCARFGLDKNTRMFQFSSFAFDASILEVLGTLISGGCVCIPSDAERVDDLVGCMTRLRINTALLTPTILRFVTPQSVPGMKTLIIGGEALRQDNVLAWAEQVDCFCAYGPTEACIVSATHQFRSLDDSFDIIGSASACQTWVVDSGDVERPVQQGEVGELLIEGPILARCYLFDDEKTAAAFVSPSWLRRFRKRNAVRAYKTGDLVRFDTENRLRYLGRKDTQFKLNGLRVEIGEVEHHLATVLPRNVESSAVFPRAGVFSGRIIGVIMPSTSLSIMAGDLAVLNRSLAQRIGIDVEAVQKVLGQKLPEYMVPSEFVCISSFPTGTAGKLDRKTLSGWVEGISTEAEDTEPIRSAATDVEMILIGVLRELLPTMSNKVDLNRTFKQLGGDSIQAMDATMRLRSRGLDIRVADLVGRRDLSDIASQCSKSNEAKHPSRKSMRNGFETSATSIPGGLNSDEITDSGPITEVSALSDGPVLTGMTPIQDLYFQLLQWPKRFHSSQFLRIGSRSLSPDNFCVAITSLVRRHDVLRARFECQGGSWKQRIEQKLKDSFSMSTYHASSTSDMREAIANVHETLNILHGPVFATILFTNDQQSVEYVFLVAHHLVVDLVSWQIIMREIDSSLRGEPLSFPTSTSYLAWQQHLASYGKKLSPVSLLPAPVPAAAIIYWGEGYSAKQLVGATTDRNSLADTVGRTFELSPEATDRILGACAAIKDVGVVDILLGSLFMSFFRAFPDRDSICIWNQTHGRDGIWDEDIEVEGTVGWFNIFVPISLDRETVDSNPAPAEFVNDTSKVVAEYRARIPGHGLPYFASRFYNVQGREDARHHLPMEVVFNYTGRSPRNAYRSFTPTSIDILEPGVPDIEPELIRTHMLDVVIGVDSEGKLGCQLGFDRSIMHQEKLAAWWTAFQGALTEWSGADT